MYSPGLVSTSIEPRCCFTTMSWLRERPEACPLARGLRCEERVEHLLLHLGRYARAVVPYPDFDLIAEVPRCRRTGWAHKEPVARSFRFTVA